MAFGEQFMAALFFEHKPEHKKTKYNNFIGETCKSAFRRGNYRISFGLFSHRKWFTLNDLGEGKVITPEWLKLSLSRSTHVYHLTYYWSTLTRLCNRLWCDVDVFSAHPPFFYFHREFKLKISHFLDLFRFICHQFQCINWIINYPRARATSTTCIVHAIDFTAHPWFSCLSPLRCSRQAQAETTFYREWHTNLFVNNK